MNITKNISELTQLSKSKIGTDSAIVIIGNILGAALGFIATILITRTLGPAQFGIFSVALAVMGIASQISDFGVSTGSVRFTSLYLKTNIQKANLIFKVSLKLKLIIGTIVFIIGFFASKPLAVHVFEKPELIFPLKLAFIGAFGTSLAGYISMTLQARQSFAKFSYMSLLNPFIKLILIALLFLTYNLNLFSTLTTIIILPFIAFLIGSMIIPRDFLNAKGDETEALHELYHFSKWILVSTLCVIIFQQLDILMLGFLKSPEEVGYFSAASQIPSALILVTGSVTTVLLPMTCSLFEKDSINNFIKKSLKYTSLIAFSMTPFLIISGPLILFLYGNQYENSIIIFSLLFSIRLLDILISPLGLIFFIHNKPELAAYLNLMQLFGNFIGNYFMIPIYGAIGAALATLIVYIIGGLFIFIYIYYKVFRK
jgi:O-antigen/teichoic acid export membrane protein